MQTVQKRNGDRVEFDVNKIINAIKKANREVEDKEKLDDVVIKKISEMFTNDFYKVEDIQDMIEEAIMKCGHYDLAKKYMLYRYTRGLVRAQKETDESILSLLQYDNKEVMEENSNKNAKIAPTQRDLIAGEVSKDISRRLLIPKDIMDANDQGILHFHDQDYFIQNIFNCMLINISDMLDNGTVMNNIMVESPKSFQVACTIMTQIIASVASSQYGGQSVNIKHLGKYLRITREKERKVLSETRPDLTDEQLDDLVKILTYKELKGGVQTIQYQINTLMTTNGQSPFVTLFLHIDDNDEYEDEVADIVCEILRQRIEGVKNEKGVDITPTFPKLVYVLDENNCFKGGKYDYVSELAAKCSAKRMYPDYISAKKMRENYDGEVFSCMGCRSFLSPWKDENGKYKWEGRFNQGVVTINLPQIGIIANGDKDKFYELLEERLELCKKALMLRYKALKGTLSDISPIHWQYGAVARLEKGEKIDKYLENGYSTLSLGYIGIYETTYAMLGVSHTTKEGHDFAIEVMKYLNKKVKEWKEETGLGFGLYGTPAESLCYEFARIDRKRFGVIENITDKGWYTNSYHVDVREKIDAFSKLKFESEFQDLSLGGCISYVEIPSMLNNLTAVKTLMTYIYENIQYGEFNTKSDYCMKCGWDGEININKDGEWECPQCHNKDHDQMSVTRRTCGYLGSNFWNVGKTKEISQRVLHL